MYSIDGIALDDDARQWGVTDLSRPLVNAQPEGSLIVIPGRDGAIATPATASPSTIQLLIETPAAGLEALLALLGRPGGWLSRTAIPARRAQFELISADPDYVDPAMTLVVVEATLRLNGAYWRDTNLSTSAAVILPVATGISATVSVLTAISAPVQDTICRVRGPVEGLTVADSAGSWWEFFPSVGANEWLRFHADTGEAYITTTDTWSGGTNRSGDVDFGGPRGVFEVTPYFTNPSTRSGALDISHTSSSTSTNRRFELRGRGAYRV